MNDFTITAAEAVAPIEYAVTYEAVYYVQATSREQALALAIAAHEDSPEGSWQIDGSDVSHLQPVTAPEDFPNGLPL